MSLKTLQLVDEFAPGYDKYINNCNWYGPDILFGLMFEYLSPKQKLLDLGIGTGLSATLFQKAGLDIYGLDGSDVMLQICREKKFTKNLIIAYLTIATIPFDLKFHHVISYAVFHFLGQLKPLVESVSGALKLGGIFGFSADIYHAGQDQDYTETLNPGVYAKTQESGLTIYKHSLTYINKALFINNFEILKSIEILAFHDKQNEMQVRFQLFITRKIN